MPKRKSKGSPPGQEGEYEVGYGKPPVQHRFQKGQSGNPKGRPPGAKGFKACLRRELRSPITIKDGGVTSTISKADALARITMNQGLGGDYKYIVYLGEQDVDDESHVNRGGDEGVLSPPTDAELAMLAQYFDRLQMRTTKPSSSAPSLDEDEGERE